MNEEIITLYPECPYGMRLSDTYTKTPAAGEKHTKPTVWLEDRCEWICANCEGLSMEKAIAKICGKYSCTWASGRAGLRRARDEE